MRKELQDLYDQINRGDISMAAGLEKAFDLGERPKFYYEDNTFNEINIFDDCDEVVGNIYYNADTGLTREQAKQMAESWVQLFNLNLEGR